jgi:hypothetical protein
MKGLGKSIISTALGKSRKECKVGLNDVLEIVPKGSKPEVVYKAISDKTEPQVRCGAVRLGRWRCRCCECWCYWW